jgi:PAS domain S-box-containing protein
MRTNARRRGQRGWRKGTAGPLRSEALVEEAAAPACVLDHQGRVLVANRALELLLGVGASGGLCGRTLPSLAYPPDEELAQAAVQQVLVEGLDRCQVDARWVRVYSRELVWAAFDLSLVRDRRGRPELAIAMVRDLTAMKRSEHERRFFEFMFKLIGEADSSHRVREAARGQQGDRLPAGRGPARARLGQAPAAAAGGHPRVGPVRPGRGRPAGRGPGGHGRARDRRRQGGGGAGAVRHPRAGRRAGPAGAHRPGRRGARPPGRAAPGRGGSGRLPAAVPGGHRGGGGRDRVRRQLGAPADLEQRRRAAVRLDGRRGRRQAADRDHPRAVPGPARGGHRPGPAQRRLPAGRPGGRAGRAAPRRPRDPDRAVDRFLDRPRRPGLLGGAARHQRAQAGRRPPWPPPTGSWSGPTPSWRPWSTAPPTTSRARWCRCSATSSTCGSTMATPSARRATTTWTGWPTAPCTCSSSSTT